MFEQWGTTWGVYGVLILQVAKMMILDPIMTRKTQFNLSSFQTLQTSVRDEVKTVLKITVDSFDELKREVVQPLIQEIKSKDYQTAVLTDVVITMLSNVNVPLNQKQEAFKRLSTLETMNKEIIATLMANLEKEKEKSEVEQKSVSQVYENLNKGV